jgi:NAD(P)-dependent dehydrogenase (short-subunit alcohol dehydrogenase family)
MSHPFSYEGRRVVVTGGSRGVGAALLDVLAELGAARVTVVDLKPPSGPHDQFVAADLSDEDSTRAAVAAIDGEVHALFNNAGVADTSPPEVVFAVNYLALRTLADGLLPRMPGGAAIANTASLAGNLWRKRADAIDELLDLDLADGWKPSSQWYDEHRDALEQGPYNFSKEIVERWTLRLARPLIRRGIRINSVCPGPIDTPLLNDFRATTSDKINDWMIREMAGRPVAPREVASTLAFLASPAASYLNGLNIDVDGGFNAAAATKQVDFSGRT